MNATRRILLIQGLAGLGSTLWHALESQPYELELAVSAADALRRARQRAFDVVLTSPSSAVAEDTALVRELRRVQPGLKTVVLAPEGTAEDAVAALRSHAFAYFRAPFEPAEVITMVERAVAVSDWRDGIDVVSASPDWISLRVAPRRLTVERLIVFIDGFLSDQPDTQREALMLAFREILLNAIEHGAGFDSDKVIEVSAIRTARAMVFHFRDPGSGFSLDDLPHAAVSNPTDQPIAHLEHREAMGMRPGGFGILMAQQLVDEVIYNGMGNEVILIKHLS